MDLKATAEQWRKRRSSSYHQRHGEATTNNRRKNSKTPGSGPLSSQVQPPPCTFLGRRALKLAQTARTTTTAIGPSLRSTLNFDTAFSVIFRSLFWFLIISIGCPSFNFAFFGTNCRQVSVFVDFNCVVSLGFHLGIFFFPAYILGLWSFVIFMGCSSVNFVDLGPNYHQLIVSVDANFLFS